MNSSSSAQHAIWCLILVHVYPRMGKDGEWVFMKGRTWRRCDGIRLTAVLSAVGTGEVKHSLVVGGNSNVVQAHYNGVIPTSHGRAYVVDIGVFSGRAVVRSVVHARRW
jgi:hypothetical protein